MGIYNWIIDVHNCAYIQLGMDIHNSIIYIDNLIMDIHNNYGYRQLGIEWVKIVDKTLVYI